MRSPSEADTRLSVRLADAYAGKGTHAERMDTYRDVARQNKDDRFWKQARERAIFTENVRGNRSK